MGGRGEVRWFRLLRSHGEQDGKTRRIEATT